MFIKIAGYPSLGDDKSCSLECRRESAIMVVILLFASSIALGQLQEPPVPGKIVLKFYLLNFSFAFTKRSVKSGKLFHLE